MQVILIIIMWGGFDVVYHIDIKQYYVNYGMRHIIVCH